MNRDWIYWDGEKEEHTVVANNRNTQPKCDLIQSGNIIVNGHDFLPYYSISLLKCPKDLKRRRNKTATLPKFPLFSSFYVFKLPEHLYVGSSIPWEERKIVHCKANWF